MKKAILIIIGLLFIGLVIAELGLFDFTAVEYQPKEDEEQIIDTITFDCGKEHKSVTTSEPNGLYDEDDLLRALRINCSKTISNIRKDGELWRSNRYGFKSFNETALKEDECKQERKTYDSGEDTCI